VYKCTIPVHNGAMKGAIRQFARVSRFRPRPQLTCATLLRTAGSAPIACPSSCFC